MYLRFEEIVQINNENITYSLLYLVFCNEQPTTNEIITFNIFSWLTYDVFRNLWTVINFQFTQRNNVPGIKQSGTKGRLQSTVQKIMDTCVYQTKT